MVPTLCNMSCSWASSRFVSMKVGIDLFGLEEILNYYLGLKVVLWCTVDICRCRCHLVVWSMCIDVNNKKFPTQPSQACHGLNLGPNIVD